MDILDRVPAMTNQRVNIGSGTLYTLLEQFLEADMILETRVDGRRRSYILTEKGRKLLEKEHQRLVMQAQDYTRVMEGATVYDTEENRTEQIQPLGLSPAY